MHKQAILDIAAEIARKAGQSGLGARLDSAHTSVASGLDRLLATEVPGTKGIHLPTISRESGRPRIVPFTAERQAPMRQMIAHNPEMALAIPAPIPGLETGLAAGKGLARRALGLPLSGVPGTNTSVQAAVGGHVGGSLQGAAQGMGSALGAAKTGLTRFMKESSMANKTAGGPEYRGRDSSAAFSTAAEQGNIDTGNAVLDGLFARKAQMRTQTEAQLGKLFNHKGYGRSRALGPSADEASAYFNTALRSGALG